MYNSSDLATSNSTSQTGIVSLAPHDRMIAALMRRKELDIAIHEKTRERDELDLRIKSIALELAGIFPNSRNATLTLRDGALLAVGIETPPPRQLRLLGAMPDGTDVTVAQLAREVYGLDTDKTKANISSELSRMHADELVSSDARGVYRIAPRGRAMRDALLHMPRDTTNVVG